MNSSYDPFAVPDEDQAALWAARLDGGSISAADRSDLAAWLAKTPANRELLSVYCQMSADLDGELSRLSCHLPAAREATAPKTTRLPTVARIAWAALALAACMAIAFISFKGPLDAEVQVSATPVAQRSRLVLADGSKVELNTQTAIEAKLGERERRVRLLKGQAFFSVSRDPSRPFIVETAAGTVRVTGTQFDVRAESADLLQVTVLEGSVQVSPQANGTGREAAYVTLSPGDQFTQSGSDIRRRQLSEREQSVALAWREGRAVFSGEALEIAISQFAHFHGRRIIVDPRVAKLVVGGRFNLDDLDGFLATLEDTFDVSIVHQDDGTLQVVPRARP